MGVAVKQLSCGETESATCLLVFLYAIILMCCWSKSKQADVGLVYTDLTGSEKHFMHPTWPWEIAIHPVRRVSVFMTFRDAAIPMINPSIRRVFSQPGAFWCFREKKNFDLFAVMHSFLQHLPLANKPNCGSRSSAGDPIEAVIPCRLKHILYFSLWQRWNWAKLAWNASAPRWKMPINEREPSLS